MWAQDWSNIFDIVAPYPDASLFQVEQGFSKKAYTEISIFKVKTYNLNILFYW